MNPSLSGSERPTGNIWPQLSLQKKTLKLSSEMICPRSIWPLRGRADTEPEFLASLPRTILTNSCYYFGCKPDELCCQVATCFPPEEQWRGQQRWFFFFNFFFLSLAHTRDGVKKARFKPGQPAGFV